MKVLRSRNRRANTVIVTLITGGSLTGVLAATGVREVERQTHNQVNPSARRVPTTSFTREEKMNGHTHHEAGTATEKQASQHDDHHNRRAITDTNEVEPGGLSISANGLTLVPERRILSQGAQQALAFRIQGEDGKAITQFTEQHEHDLHLVVVRRDLAHFQHLHPQMHEDGTWTAEIALPVAGTYRAFADFQTGDGQATVLATDLFVGGAFQPEDLPEQAWRVVTEDGYEVALKPATPVRSGQPVQLRFTVTKPGGSVTLTPVMGARGHLIALREGDLAFIHAHPADESAETATAGAIDFHLVPPSAGHYRLFLQFADAGRLQTLAFTLAVSSAA